MQGDILAATPLCHTACPTPLQKRYIRSCIDSRCKSEWILTKLLYFCTNPCRQIAAQGTYWGLGFQKDKESEERFLGLGVGYYFKKHRLWKKAHFTGACLREHVRHCLLLEILNLPLTERNSTPSLLHWLLARL